MKNNGFTIVELIVVITIMGILLVLGVVNFTSSQANSRDSERKMDIETIATYLETYYKSGITGATIGEYPSVDPTNSLIGQESTFFSDLNTDAIKTPGSTTSSLVAATNSIQTTSAVTPQPTISQYVYQPIETNGSLCNSLATQECRKFNLFYRLEVDGLVYVTTSKNQ